MRLRMPHTARNREPIFDVLRRFLPESGLVLEIAAGAGEHAVFLAGKLPDLEFQPTDIDPRALDSIEAWREHSGLSNLRPPRRLDVTDDPWPVQRAAAVMAVNMVHISPWEATLALLAGTVRILPSGGVLYLYGPYRLDEQHTAPSNAAFDTNLRGRDPSWGIRDLEAVIEAAAAVGLAHTETVAMPANNQSVVFHKLG